MSKNQEQTLPMAMVTLSDIYIQPDNNKSRWNHGKRPDVEGLAKAIKDRADGNGLPMGQGLIQPVVVRAANGEDVYPTTEGSLEPVKITEPYVLLAGFQRCAALALLEASGNLLGDIPIRILEDTTNQDSLITNVEENTQRTDLTLMDYSTSINNMSAQGMSGSVIADHLGKKKAWVSVVGRFTSLSLPIQKQLADGTLNFRDGRELTIMKTDEDRAAYVSKKEAGMSTVQATTNTREGKTKDKRGRKAAEETTATEATTEASSAGGVAVKKGPSAKAAILDFTSMVEQYKEQAKEQELTAQEACTSEIFKAVTKYLKGGLGIGGLRKNIIEQFAA